MIGIAFYLAAFATAGLAAAAIGLPSLVATLLAAYVVYVAELTGEVLVLSPADAVDRTGLAVTQGLLLVAAAATWWWRGRLRPALVPARAALVQIVRDPPTLVFVLVVAAALGYELALGLTVPANDYDALTYHLVRATDWARHGGYSWIANAPYDPINDYGAIAEQQILYGFVAAGLGALQALPQYLAELAVLVAAYGMARRLGSHVCAATGAACLLATFGLVALESTTAQNDLVAASLAASAGCFLLGRTRREQALGGVAVGLALGVKLTTLLALPVLVWLALLRGRRAASVALAGAVSAFCVFGVWPFILNLIHTGTFLGPGGRAGNAASPGYPRTLLTALDTAYTLLDLSALSNHLIFVFEIVGIAAGACVAGWALLHRARPGRALVGGARVAIPFLAPLIVIGAGNVLAWVGQRVGHPIRGPLGTVGPLTRVVDSDVSAFGPLGAVALGGVSALTLVAYLRRRADARQLALAAAIPVCLIGLACESTFNPFLPRFFLAAAALTAPLLARLVHGRAAATAYLAVGATVLWLTLTHDFAKPLHSAFGHPWQLTQLDALELVQPGDVAMVAAYDRIVPTHACVGAALGRDEPAYLLGGPEQGRDVVFLPTPVTTPPGAATVEAAYADGASYVVLSRGLTPPTPPGLAVLPAEFAAAGWRLRPLGGIWTLAVAPHVVSGLCSG